MNKSALIKTALIGGALYAVYEAFSNLQNIKVTFAGLAFDSISWSGIGLTAKFDVLNPSRIPVPVRNIDGSITLQTGGQVGTFFVSNPGTIQANTTSRIKIPLQIQNAKIAELIWQVLNGEVVSKLPVTVKGNVSTAAGTVPFSQTHVIKLVP